MAKNLKQVKLKDKEFALSYPESEIQQDIDVVASKINWDYRNDKDIPVFLCMLNGSFMFAADLMKRINFQCEVSFVKYSSYSGTKTTGSVNQLIGLNSDLKGRSIIVVEDIVETGNTLTTLFAELNKLEPKSVKVCSLLFKPNCFKGSMKIDYIGRSIPDDFIVGYGLDYDNVGRNLADIYTLISK